MAKLGPFTNAYLLINAINLSDHVETVTLDVTKADVDITAMGDGGHKRMAGLEDDKLDVSFFQDFAASSVDATLYPIFSAGTAVAFKLAANGTAISATNPAYSGSVVLLNYQPIGGKVGDALMSPVSFVISGTISEGTV